MNLNIDLFVHGVPMGQTIWGPKGEDQRYLSSFYGPKWDVPEVMKIDIITFGNTSYCYYTFVKGQNVYDYQGRAGSYIALTLRINAFYADIQNMYCILKAAYEKMCVGLCVSETNGSTKFLLPDFENVDSQLKNIENQILNYIREFSISDDIVGLIGFTVGSQSSIRNINLHECTKKIALEQFRLSGKMIVSPWFLSESASKTLAQYKAEAQSRIEKIQNENQLQQQASQEKISLITKQYQDELKVTKEKSKEQLKQLTEDCEHKISEIKESYADVDAKLDKQKQKIKDLEREKSALESQCRQKDKEIKRIKKELPDHDIEEYDQYQPSRNKENRWIRNSIYVIIVLFVGALGWSTFYYFNHQKERKQGNQTEQLDTLLNSRVDSCSSNAGSMELSSVDEKSATIIIKEFTSPNDSIKAGGLYHVLIKGQESENGNFESKEFEFQSGNIVMAKREYVGKFGTISYIVDGNVKASIKIYIKE